MTCVFCVIVVVTCSDNLLDLVFVVDSSGSIQDKGANNYNLLLTFIVNVINDLDIGANRTRVGLVKFSNQAESMFFLNTYNNKADLGRNMSQCLFMISKVCLP